MLFTAKLFRGLLIFGPTGSGKTSLAHAIASEFDIPFIDVTSTEVMSGVSGESEANLRAIFDSALVWITFLDACLETCTFNHIL